MHISNLSSVELRLRKNILNIVTITFALCLFIVQGEANPVPDVEDRPEVDRFKRDVLKGFDCPAAIMKDDEGRCHIVYGRNLDLANREALAGGVCPAGQMKGDDKICHYIE